MTGLYYSLTTQYKTEPGCLEGRDMVVGRGVRIAAASPTGSCPLLTEAAPPCPADLLEPLHQPGGQSWWDMEQKSLLL